MTRFESKISTINANKEKIFDILSDFNNLEKYKGNIPENDNIKDIVCTADSCEFTVNPVGKIGLRIVERTPSSEIALKSEQSPIKFLMWIHLEQVNENETQLKIMLDADINVILKGMITGPIQKFIDILSTQLTNLTYN
jgi:hypothetical protein